MPKRDKPRRGSLQYWPRRRAKRIYPRISHWAKTKELRPLGFAGWKAGMTHIQFTNNAGKLVTKPVTVLDAPSLLVCGLRFYEKTPSLHVIGEKWVDKISKNLGSKRNLFTVFPEIFNFLIFQSFDYLYS